ncbi:MAG: metallophosphoesterase family protein [Bacteroidetes bacterium]|nr:metallophosphoesterase family protein [Bacteroidota bacterium]
MKKIVIISDTHGFTDKNIIKYCEQADEIWHAGDWGPDVNNHFENLYKTIRGVYGNIDGAEIRKIYPETNIFNIENMKVIIKHIGGYPQNYNIETKKMLSIEKPSILICGHSHILRVINDRQNNCLYINPGAAGIYGFHKKRTLITCKIDNGKIFDMNVVELGNRNTLEK